MKQTKTPGSSRQNELYKQKAVALAPVLLLIFVPIVVTVLLWAATTIYRSSKERQLNSTITHEINTLGLRREDFPEPQSKCGSKRKRVPAPLLCNIKLDSDPIYQFIPTKDLILQAGWRLSKEISGNSPIYTQHIAIFNKDKLCIELHEDNSTSLYSITIASGGYCDGLAQLSKFTNLE